MVLHPIYQQLLEGGHNPLFLSATTERMLRVARNPHLWLTRVVSLVLNGSYLEKMSDNKDGKLPLELVDIWNESFSCLVV